MTDVTEFGRDVAQYDGPRTATEIRYSSANGFDVEVYRVLFLLLLECVRIPEYVWGKPIRKDDADERD